MCLTLYLILLFVFLVKDTDGSFPLKKRLNLLEDRYDADRIQYRSDIRELHLHLEEMEQILNSTVLETASEISPEHGTSLCRSCQSDANTVKDILEHTEQTLARFQDGLKEEKMYMRKELKLFADTMENAINQLKIDVDKSTNILNDKLATVPNICRAEIRTSSIIRNLREGINQLDNKIVDLSAKIVNSENQMKLNINQHERSVSERLRGNEAKTEKLLEELKKSISCSDGWIRHESYCYYFSRDKRNWHSARDRCKALGGYLAEPVQDHDFMYLYVMFGHTNFWMGGNDFQRGHWVWDHRATVISKQNTNWSPGQPDGVRNEHCLEWRQPFQAWNDIPCSIPHHYICQK